MDFLDDDHFHDECAVIGVWGHAEASKMCYLGLYALQHRGQEGAGIVTSDGESIHGFKKMGLVADVFTPQTLEGLAGNFAIGHTRYATYGSKDWQNLQPFVANVTDNSFAVAHNGNLINAQALRRELEKNGAIFSSTSDTEVFLHLIAREGGDSDFIDRLSSALTCVRGAYSLAILRPRELLAVRDPYGVRPLSIATIAGGYVVASETCAFDLIGATFLREVQPGEIVRITADGRLESRRFAEETHPAKCVFEYIYFSRPDSTMDGRNVYLVRKALGAQLAEEQPAVADIVVPVPDSGVMAAMGYAEKIGLQLELGLIRNHYVGRTFIEPKQSIRDFGVKIKLNPNHEVLKDKRVIVVDDSIVRGTTSRKIVTMLREAGAREVHFRVSSPPTVGPCHYGIDTPSREELIASSHTWEQIREYICADSIGYLSVEGMYKAVGAARSGHCDACFSLQYRLGVPQVQSSCAAQADSAAGAKGEAKARSGVRSMNMPSSGAV